MRETTITQQMQDLSPRWWTVRQVAHVLGFGESKVRTLIMQGDLRSVKIGRDRRVFPEWVEEFVTRCKARAEAEWPDLEELGS